MAEKIFNNVRIVNKHETEANWLKSSFIPKQGELIVYDIDSTHSYERIKIGDGEHNVNALPFVGDELSDFGRVNTTITSDVEFDAAIDDCISQMSNDSVRNASINWHGLHSVTIHKHLSNYVDVEDITYQFTDNLKTSYYKRTRSMVEGTWNEWEYVNPPMLRNVEYRTTDRYNGKAVYKRLNSDGILQYKLYGDSEWSLYSEIIGANDYTDEQIANMIGDTKVSDQISAAVANKADIGHIHTLDETVPDYWLTALQDGAESINIAIANAGDNKSAFLFYSDMHWNDSAKNTPELLKYIYKSTGLTKTIFGGDIVATENMDYDTMSYLWDWRNAIKDLPNHHSVVGNHDDGNITNNLFTEEYVYGYLLSAEETPDIVRSDNGLYYYIDVPTEKTRYLYLDTAYQGVGIEQQNFVKEALMNTPANWHIVAVAHIWHDVNYTTTPHTVGGLNAHASILIDMFDKYNARLDEFNSCVGWVEFCIGGHTHIDNDSQSNGGIPIVLVETASSQVRSGLDGTTGTTNESSFNGIIANYETKTLSIVRIGRGVSREVALVAHEDVVIGNPNLIPVSTNSSGEITGLMTDKRYNSSGLLTDSSVGHNATGYMPAADNNTLQFSGFNFNTEIENADSSYVWFYDDTYTKVNGFAAASENPGSNYQIVRDANGNIIQMVVPSGQNIAYFTVCALSLNAKSKIVNLSVVVGKEDEPQDLPIVTDDDNGKMLGVVNGVWSAIDQDKITIDDKLSSTSTNPVQNNVVNSAINSLTNLVGDTKVSEQISTAIDEATADDFGIYVQAQEPTGAVAGDIWIDTANDPSYIPPTIPEITEADNGKVLMVVNGKLQLVKLNMSIDANGVVYM